jgi:predicted nucleic acid-binding protein
MAKIRFRRKLSSVNRGVNFLELEKIERRNSSRHRQARTPIEEDALAWLRAHDEREYSFVDATSFAYMRAKGIQDALAFDGDFAAAGFTELRP